MTEKEKLQSKMVERARKDTIRYIYQNLEKCSLRECEMIKMIIYNRKKQDSTVLSNGTRRRSYAGKL